MATVQAGVTIRTWRGPSPASDIVFCRIDGGGHTWPGSRRPLRFLFGATNPDFDATGPIWRFLAGHAREP